MKKKYAVVAVSGGMDSTSLLLHLLREGYTVKVVSFYYGQKHKIELERLKKNIEYITNSIKTKIDHNIIDISSVMKYSSSALTKESQEVPKGHYEEEQMKATVVPNRNAIFTSIIYSYALSIALETNSKVILALGVHSGDHAIYPDCRPEFYEALINSFKIGNWESEKVELYLPYLNGDKLSILQDADDSCKEFSIDFDIIMGNTCTSYDPTEDGLSSGKTGSDIERILAFYEFGRKDPVPYVNGWEYALENALKVKNDYENKSKNQNY